jgi:hypothetical protein
MDEIKGVQPKPKPAKTYHVNDKLLRSIMDSKDPSSGDPGGGCSGCPGCP